ncbi:unnamed protein product [Heligmosomoides polygyrus]|uniref:Uncharacterized protein n=1 Tax=Heligmosomoides polygyrus TaxID=6339 RepID=A0A183FJI7_HELPZ|nr:unnamed protein product [Heligmosomoides polygyrus]
MAVVDDNLCGLESDYDVDDDKHFLHLRFRCDEQPFPAVDGRPGFPLPSCHVSQMTIVPRSLRPAGKPLVGSRGLGSSRAPSIKDGRVSKRHLKREEQRQERILSQGMPSTQAAGFGAKNQVFMERRKGPQSSSSPSSPTAAVVVVALVFVIVDVVFAEP